MRSYIILTISANAVEVYGGGYNYDSTVVRRRTTVESASNRSCNHRLVNGKSTSSEPCVAERLTTLPTRTAAARGTRRQRKHTQLHLYSPDRSIGVSCARRRRFSHANRASSHAARLS